MPNNDTTINAVSPEGELGYVPPQNMDTALQQGFTKPTVQQLSEYNEKQLYNDKFLKTGAVSAVQTALPFGVGAAGLEAAGVSGEEQQKLQQYNPLSSIAGAIAGTFAPGTGLGKVAGKIGEGAGYLSKLLGLGEDAGVASKIATQMARGAAEGATFGASNVANDAVTGDPSLVAQHALSEIGTSALWGAGITGALGVGALAVPKGIGAARSAMSNLSDSMGLSSALQTAKEAGQNVYASASSAFSGIPKDKILEAFENMGKEAAPVKATEFASDLQELHNSVEGALKEAANDFDNLTPETKNAIGDYINSVDTTRGTGDYAKSFMYKSSQGLKIDPAKVETYLKNSGTARGAKAAAAYSDYVSNASNLIDHLDHEYSLGASESNPDISAIKQLVEKNKTVLEQQQDAALASRLSNEGAGAGGFGEAAGIGAAGSLLGLPHPVIGAIAGTLEVLRNPIETINKLAGLQKTVSSGVQKMGRLADALASGAGSSAAGTVKGYVAGQAAIPDKAAYNKVATKIESLGQDLGGTSSKLAQNAMVLHPHAPAVATAMQQTATRALSFLQSKLTSTQPAGPLAKKPEPSQTQISAFSKYYAAVERPMSVLKDALEGTLTHEGIEAISQVHPELFAQMKSTLVQKLSENKKSKDLPYHRKLMLSLLTGQDLDGSTNPMSMQANQMMLGIAAAQQAQKEQAFIGTPKPTSKGLREIGIANRALTAQQATAQRSEA